jgi:hypothetical protein
MARRDQPEAQLRRTAVQHLRCRGVRGAVWWLTPNGGARHKIEAAILKGLGVRAGVADLCIVHAVAFRAEINAAGGFATEAVGLDAALRCLEAWGLLLGAAL